MRFFTEQEKRDIDVMYHSGEKIDDIRSHLHCKEETLRNYLKENGYVRRKRNSIKGSEQLGASRKHFFNQSYFREIDSRDKAYWLGFLYADGNVSFGKAKNGDHKGATIEISLKSADKGHLEKLLISLEADFDYPIEDRFVHAFGKMYSAVRVSFNSVVMANDLIALGCVPNKSLVLNVPSINKDFYPDFIRGYFDGDGCVSYNPLAKKGVFSVLGTKEIVEFIKENSGVSKNISVRQSKHDGEIKEFYEMSINGIASAITFYKYIYQGDGICLDRKKKLSDQFFQMLEQKVA